MSLFPITSIYAALCGLLVLALAVLVAHLRRIETNGVVEVGMQGLKRRSRRRARTIYVGSRRVRRSP